MMGDKEEDLKDLAGVEVMCAKCGESFVLTEKDIKEKVRFIRTSSDEAYMIDCPYCQCPIRLD